jgi:hypothetical protein
MVASGRVKSGAEAWRALGFHAAVLLCGLAIGLGSAAGSARADDDDDNANAGAPAPPRVALQSDDLELVAVAQGRKLFIYVDRLADNGPAGDAEIAIDVGDKSFQPAAVAQGLYLLTDDWVAVPGPHDLGFTVTTKAGMAILSGTLTIPSPQAGKEAVPAGTASAAPMRVSLPLDALLVIATGLLAVVGAGAMTIFKLARAKASPARREEPAPAAGPAGRSGLARLAVVARIATARLSGWIAVTFVVLAILALLLLGRGVLASEAGPPSLAADAGVTAR